MNSNADTLFFVALWAWMRAHHDGDFDSFSAAMGRILDRIAKARASAQQEAPPS